MQTIIATIPLQELLTSDVIGASAATQSALQTFCSFMTVVIGILSWLFTIVRNRRTGNRNVGILFIAGIVMGVLLCIGQDSSFPGYVFVPIVMGFANIVCFISITHLIAIATEK